MKISDAKVYLSSVFAYNLEEYERGNGHKNFVVPFFVGDPGVGKTAIPRQVAAEAHVGYHQTIVAQFDPGELAGLPFMGEVEIDVMREGENGERHMAKESRTRMVRLRPSYLPDPQRVDQQIGIYNLDELPQAMLAGQNVMSQLVNEWRIGEHAISPAITICCTGNKPENKAGTTTMPTHLKDRLNFINIDTDLDETLTHFAQIGVNPKIRAFLKNNPQWLHKFDVAATANPTPRSWEKTGAVLAMNLPKHIRAEGIAGQLGTGCQTVFEQWLRVEDRMPDLERLIANPEDSVVAPVFGNRDSDVAYLILMALADRTKQDNIANILKYIRRLPNQEFTAVWAQDVKRRDPAMLQTREMTEWKLKDGAKLMI